VSARQGDALDGPRAPLDPELHPDRVAFCLLPRGVALPSGGLIASFVEAEGTTVVLAEAEARALGLDVRFVADWITLRLHTALDGVGLTAAHHDHLFVPAGDGERAMRVLAALPGMRGQST
jgi:hypothetical protein